MTVSVTSRASFVQETSTTIGTGPYELAGAVTGPPQDYQTFVAGNGDGEVVCYAATDGTDWEVCEGTITDASPDTLSRDTVLESSNGGLAVDWGAGTKIIYQVFTPEEADAFLSFVTVSDIDSGASADGQVLTSDGAGGAAWETPSVGASALDDLTDVTITSPATDEVLKYDGVGWVSSAVPDSGGGMPVLEALQWSEHNTYNQTAVTATAPSGITAGELLFVIVTLDSNQSGPQYDEASISGSGWNFETTFGNTSIDLWTALYWKIADGTEGDVTLTALVSPGYSNNRIAWYGRVSGASGVHSYLTDSSAGSSHTHSPAVTTEPSLVLMAFAADFDGYASISGAGWTEVDNDAGTRVWSVFASFEETTAAEAGDLTINRTGGNNHGISLSVAFAPTTPVRNLGELDDVSANSPTSGDVLSYNGDGWTATPGAQAIVLDVGDETTDLTTGAAKKTFRMPYAFTLTDVRASVTTAPTGAAIQVDINEGGASILSTVLSIDATEKTSTTAATPAVISDAALADDAEITIDIDQVGAGTAGAGLKVTLVGSR